MALRTNPSFSVFPQQVDEYSNRCSGYEIHPSEFAKDHLFYSTLIGNNVWRNTVICRRPYVHSFLVGHINSGNLVIGQYERSVTVKKDESFFISMYDPHKLQGSKQNLMCNFDFIHINGKNIWAFVDLLKEHVDLPFVYHSDYTQKIIYTIQDIYNTVPYKRRDFEISAQVYRLLSDMLYSLLYPNVTKNINKTIEFMTTINNYIDENINRNITLDDLCRLLSFSKFYFSRLFKEHFDDTPKHYVLRKKIEKSKYFLLYTDKTTAEICSELGFSGQNHFIKTFKSFENCTPTQYVQFNNGNTKTRKSARAV